MTISHTNDLFLLMYSFTHLEWWGGDNCEPRPSLSATAAIHHDLVFRVRRPELYKVNAVGASLQFKGKERKRLKTSRWLIQWKKVLP